MGAIKSVTQSYSSNEYLFWYIEKNDIAKIQSLLSQKPQLINQNISINFKTTPLHRAASNGNLPLVQLLVEKYEANVDLQTSVGETALIGCTKRNRLDIVQYLLVKNCNTQIYSNCGLSALDFAILQGFYSVSKAIFESSPSIVLRNVDQYKQLGKKYKYRYVNYKIFIEALQRKIEPVNVPQFLKKEQQKLQDPVVDPRQTWKQWFLRNIQFKDPPLVQRSELSEELQPQNQKLATLRHTFTKLTMSPLAQRISLYPTTQSEGVSDCKFHQDHASANTETFQIKASN